MVKFHDRTIVPALGLGSANLAQGRRPDRYALVNTSDGLGLCRLQVQPLPFAAGLRGDLADCQACRR
jgi:hypothetical protein